jgi:hypothetical protein
MSAVALIPPPAGHPARLETSQDFGCGGRANRVGLSSRHSKTRPRSLIRPHGFDGCNRFGFRTGRPVRDRPKTCELWLRSGNPASPPYPLRREPFASQNVPRLWPGAGGRGEPGFPPGIRKPASPRFSALTGSSTKTDSNFICRFNPTRTMSKEPK